MNNLTSKYVISPIDNNRYCRKNGQFLRHLQANGYATYQHFFESFFPHNVKSCTCGKKCKFIPTKMTYTNTCGQQRCINDVISNVKRRRSKKQLDSFRQKYKEAMLRKSDHEIKEIIHSRTQSGHNRGSYKASVKKREKTCEEIYGNKKYNNSKQISQSKLDWDELRKQLFLARLKLALGNKTLNDFHTNEMYIARRKMLEERGDIIPLEQLSEWQQYNKRVRNLTEKNYREYKIVINPNNYNRGNKEYELDHIVPVFYGFQNQIPEELVASVENLQMLKQKDNRIKGKKYDPTTSTKHKELEN